MHRSQIEYGLTPDDDRVSLFSKARNLGFQGIEFGVGLDYREDPLWTGEGDLHQTMRTAAERTGVEPVSICLHLLNYREHSPASDEVKHRKVADGIIRKSVEACAGIGASVILVPFFGTAVLKSEEQVRRMTQAMERLSPLAEENNVCLALETSLKAVDVVRVIEDIGSSYVQAYFDTGNTVSMKYDLVQEIEGLGEHIVQVHVKDNPSISMLGEGRVDFEVVIDTLQRVGFDGYLMLETPATDRPVAAAARNLNYLTQVVEKIHHR